MARDPDERRAKKIIANAMRTVDHVGHLEVERLNGPLTKRHCLTGAVEQIREAYSQAKYAMGALPKTERRRYGKEMKRMGRQVRAVQTMQREACSLFTRPSKEWGKRDARYEQAGEDFYENGLRRKRWERT